jgi:hypothetical protein
VIVGSSFRRARSRAEALAHELIFLYKRVMLARRPSRRHPPLSAPRGPLRAAYRLSAGFSPAAVARAEAVAEREVDALLDFRRLLDAVRALAALPEEERLARLEQMAWCTLELALADTDWRCAAFVLTERRLGCNPARTLAQRVVKAQARAAAAAPPPAVPKPAEPASPPRAPRPYDPAGAAVRRVAVRLRDAVAAEAALAHEPAPPAPQPAAAPAPSPDLPRRPDSGLAARLRGGTASVRFPDAAEAASPRGLLRAWAQGP